MFKPTRYICNVFEDMRGLDEGRNYGALKGLIEEGQLYANRMEDALDSSKETARMINDWLNKSDRDLEELRRIILKRYPDLED